MYSQPYALTRAIQEVISFVDIGLNVEEISSLTPLGKRIVREVFHDRHTTARAIAESPIELLALQGHLPRTISRMSGISLTQADDLTAPLRVYYRKNIKASIYSLEEAKRLFNQGYDVVEVLLQTSCDEELIKSLYYREYLSKVYNKEVRNE